MNSWCCSVGREHIMGAFMSVYLSRFSYEIGKQRTSYGRVHVCLSVALILQNRQFSRLPQGVKRTQGVALRTCLSRPKRRLPSQVMPKLFTSDLCPLRPTSVWGFDHRVWSPWLCSHTPFALPSLDWKPLGFCHLR
jgi:hypothetical protein